MTVSQRLQHQLKERHSKFGLLSYMYSVYTFICHKGETKREIEQIGTRQHLQYNRDIIVAKPVQSTDEIMVSLTAVKVIFHNLLYVPL